MQRAKIKKKKIQLTESELNKLKREVTKNATDKACLILLAAVADELSIDDDQLCNIMSRTNRYASYVSNHIAKMEDIRKTIQSKTGILLKGWSDE